MQSVLKSLVKMGSRLALGLALFGSAAFSDDGVYLHSFDPVQQSQIEAAFKAIDKYSLDRVLFVIDPQVQSKTEISKRIELLKEATVDLRKIVILTENELSDLKKNAAEFWKKNPPIRGQYRILTDDLESPDTQAIKVVGKLEKFDRRKRHVQVLSRPIDDSLIRADIAAHESLLPKKVVRKIKEKKIYPHSGKRGYYGLPDTLTDQIDFEQKLNDRIENIDVFASINKSDLPLQYYPENRPVFPIEHVDVPEDELVGFQTGAMPSGIVFLKNGVKTVRFFIHPHSKKLFKKVFKDYTWNSVYWATPTSSHRSLIVWNPDDPNEPPVGIKTTLDATVGESLRHLTKAQVQRGAGSSALIHSMDSLRLEKQGIIFIDEPFGTYSKANELGYSVRSLPQLTENVRLVPMFSLYSKQWTENPETNVSLLVQKIRESGKTPAEFLEHQIIEPLVRQFMFLAFEYGAVFEPHEQNLLMEFENNKPTGRFYYRDLAGLIVQPKLRERAGLTMAYLPESIEEASLRTEFANPILNAMSYLRQSNFFAMHQSVGSVFSEINENWVDSVFRKHMAKNLSRYTGDESQLIPDWKSSYRKYLENKGCNHLLMKDERNQ